MPTRSPTLVALTGGGFSRFFKMSVIAISVRRRVASGSGVVETIGRD
jgi:hypothetical protein